MFKFCELLDLKVSSEVKSLKVTSVFYFRSKEKEIEVFTITPNKDSRPIFYPIPPKPLIKENDIAHELYSLYQKGEHCDLTLKLGDQKFPVHFTQFLCRGGEMIKKMFSTTQEGIAGKRN